MPVASYDMFRHSLGQTASGMRRLRGIGRLEALADLHVALPRRDAARVEGHDMPWDGWPWVRSSGSSLASASSF